MIFPNNLKIQILTNVTHQAC